MAYVIADGAIMQARIESRHENQQILSVFTYKLSGAGTIPDGAAALEAFWNAFCVAGGFLESYLSCISEKLNAVKTHLQWIAPDRFAYITRQDPVFIAGAVAGDSMPVNTAVTITKRTQNAGRRQVGTLHMPAVPAAGILNGSVTGIQRGRYELFTGKILTPITTAVPVATYTPCHFHRIDPTITQPLNACEVAAFARIMRRRTVGLGS